MGCPDISVHHFRYKVDYIQNNEQKRTLHVKAERSPRTSTKPVFLKEKSYLPEIGDTTDLNNK